MKYKGIPINREKIMNIEINQSVNYWPYKNLLFKGVDEKHVHLEDQHGNRKKVYIDWFIKHGSFN